MIADYRRGGVLVTFDARLSTSQDCVRSDLVTFRTQVRDCKASQKDRYADGLVTSSRRVSV